MGYMARHTNKAGRPPAPLSSRHGLERVTAFVTPDVRQLIDQLCARTGLTRGDVLAAAVEMLANENSEVMKGIK